MTEKAGEVIMENNFGKLLGYEVNDCEIKVSFEKREAYFSS